MAPNVRRPLAILPLMLLSASARATVVEPNGKQVPINSGGEVQLFQLFQQRGEMIDWQNDAHTVPAVFSPGCGFNAEYVLNQAGSHFGLAWYNANGAMPQQLFSIVPPNSAVGYKFKGTDIINDPNYKGGLIGFALVGGQTHYSEQQWNEKCVFCGKPGPWALALIYQSSVTFGAYYLAFEDGNVDQFSFGNDGDFNDDVFFISGVTCAGGGAPCKTGKPGVCSDGITECDKQGQLGCKQVNAGGMETCDGVDENCDGEVDEGAMCPNGLICDRGRCVETCGSGEFQCTGDLVCDNGVCVDQGCVGKRCPAGQVCRSGACAGACDGVKCPFEQVCRLGRCVDPCAGSNCGADTVCVGGACVPACNCKPCTMGMTCAMTGRCVEPKCDKMMCPAGQHCSGGACVDDCDGAVCPRNQSCMMGQCVDNPIVDMAVEPVMYGSDLGAGTVGDDEDPSWKREEKLRNAGCSCRMDPRGTRGWPADSALVLLAVCVIARKSRGRNGRT